MMTPTNAEIDTAFHALLSLRGAQHIDAEGYISVRQPGKGAPEVIPDDVRDVLERAGYGTGGEAWKRYVAEVILGKARPTEADEGEPRADRTPTKEEIRAMFHH